ncbi:zinc finger protein ZAT11-like [Abrus precatorius]|uniref:Zinc finger protein ZAT11-like n=1 Tax=Abrus precatorius TaxID=3816 RepID=A0A8B8KH81_ABRPR|nr:zinc finger protein ZAT11-like [Abrus precatorius]
MKREREEGELNKGNCLMLLTKVGESETNSSKDDIGAFKCKTCNRRFSSFQALGGHRASHKKPKLMVTDLSCHHDRLQSPTMKPRMHPCPVCGLEFAIGQALGGHMRKHRSAINDGLMTLKHSLPILKKSKDAKRLNGCLDLNLTPLENDLKLNLRVRLS